MTGNIENIFINYNKEEYSDSPIYFLKTFFDFGYYLLIYPYRFYHKKSTNEYEAKYSIPHHFLCIFAQCLAVFRFGSSLRKVPVKDIKNNSSIYFALVQGIESLLYHSTFFYMTWFKSHVFISAFNLINGSWGAKFLSFALCLFYTIKGSLDIVLGYKFIPVSSWSLPNLLSSYLDEGKFIFFQCPNYTLLENKNYTSSQLNDFETWDYFTVILMGIMQFFREITAHFSDLGLLLFCLTLLWYARDFELSIQKSISGEDEMSGQEILRKYDTLKKLCKILNMAFGPVVLIYIFEAIPYYSAHMGDFMVISDWYHQFRFSFFSLQLVITLVLAAFVAHKSHVLKEWLESNDNYGKIQESKLTFLLHEINSHPIGLSLNGITTINFRFLSTMLSIIVTYFIIMLQFKAGACTCNSNSDDVSKRRVIGIMPYISV